MLKEQIEYEKAIGQAALFAHKKVIEDMSNSELASKIDHILSEFKWLDSSFGGDPKTREGVILDIKDLLSFGNDIERILNEREGAKSEKAAEQKKVMAEVLAKASPEQKRSIRFACLSAELGSVLVDEIMKFVFYRRAIYKEFARRLKLTENQAKCLMPEELKDCLLNGTSADTDVIQKRNKLSVFVLDKEKYMIYVGEEASKIQKELNENITQDVKPLKGEIAFSAGKVRGVARLVNDVKDMGKIKDGDILVSSRTYPDLLPAMRRAKAVVAELGGLLSHAAIVSRELHIPCVVGVRNATTRIKDGDEIEVDTVTGAISIINSYAKN